MTTTKANDDGAALAAAYQILLNVARRVAITETVQLTVRLHPPAAQRDAWDTLWRVLLTDPSLTLEDQ